MIGNPLRRNLRLGTFIASTPPSFFSVATLKISVLCFLMMLRSHLGVAQNLSKRYTRDVHPVEQSRSSSTASIPAGRRWQCCAPPLFLKPPTPKTQLHFSTDKRHSQVVACRALTDLAFLRRGSGGGVDAVALEEGSGETRKFIFQRNNQNISPWHDLPLSYPSNHVDNAVGDGIVYRGENSDDEAIRDRLLTFVCEIPKNTRAKMELDCAEPLNPIRQDMKSTTNDRGEPLSVPRDYALPIFWNYGFFPRTWEDPEEKATDSPLADDTFRQFPSACGDNDPLDAVEIGTRQLQTGHIAPVKVLGALSMIDQGEIDWKIIVISAHDPKFSDVNTLEDVEKYFPLTLSGIREWFRWYKVPDGKGINSFAHNERYLSPKDALEVVWHTHASYCRLAAGEASDGSLWVPSAE